MSKKKTDAGQATVEYILILSAAVVFTLIVVNGIIRPSLTLVGERVSAKIKKEMFSPDGFHRLPFGR